MTENMQPAEVIKMNPDVMPKFSEKWEKVKKIGNVSPSGGESSHLGSGSSRLNGRSNKINSGNTPAVITWWNTPTLAQLPAPYFTR